MVDKKLTPENLGEIEDIQAFNQAERYYLLFKLSAHPYSFLYVSKHDHTMHALFFGENIAQLVDEVRRGEPQACLECRIGAQFEGVITRDSGELLNSNLSLDVADAIIEKLMKHPVPEKNFLRSFSSPDQPR